MAEKISVGKKKKIIAGAIAGAVVLTGVGVGVGFGLAGGEKLPDKLVEFVVEESGVNTVYTTTGEAVSVKDLVPGQKILFPIPEQTILGTDDNKEYFVGWATRREASTPTYFVGEETITVSNKTQSFYAVYMKASTSSLIFSDNGGADDYYTVAYNGTTTSSEGIVVIPNEYEGKPVKAITKRAGLEEVALLQRVIIAEGVQEIGDEAFYGCKNLRSVIFSNVNYNFEAANATLSVKGSLFDETSLEGLTKIGSKAFYNCGNLKTINLPSTLETIGESAFEKAGVEKINLPKAVKTIGFKAFAYAESLKEFNFEEGSLLENIGSQALRNIAVEVLDMRGCANLAEIATDSKGDSAVFACCPDLREIYFSEATKTIGNTVNMLAFNSKLETVVLPTTLEGELVYTFAGCGRLKEIEIPKGITKIATRCFQNCYSLEKVAFAKGSQLENVGYNGYEGVASFTSCYSLREIGELDDNGEISVNRLPNQEDGIYNIDVGMFSGCYALNEYDLTGLTMIPAKAFQYSGIKNIVIPSTVTKVCDRAFWWMGQLETVTIQTEGQITFIGDVFEYVAPNHTGDTFYDMNGNKFYDEGDVLGDYNGNGVYDAEIFVDANGNGKYDQGEEFGDVDGNKTFTYNSPVGTLKSITVGENVTSIVIKNENSGKPSNYYGRQVNLDTILFEGETAPAIYVGAETDEANRVGLEVFLRARTGQAEGDSSYTVYVPAGSVDAYKTAFADHADNIEAIG